jgi:hypothetical protein
MLFVAGSEISCGSVALISRGLFFYSGSFGMSIWMLSGTGRWFFYNRCGTNNVSSSACSIGTIVYELRVSRRLIYIVLWLS